MRIIFGPDNADLKDQSSALIDARATDGVSLVSATVIHDCACQRDGYGPRTLIVVIKLALDNNDPHNHSI
jgi:hypothetical protein